MKLCTCDECAITPSEDCCQQTVRQLEAHLAASQAEGNRLTRERDKHRENLRKLMTAHERVIQERDQAREERGWYKAALQDIANYKDLWHQVDRDAGLDPVQVRIAARHWKMEELGGAKKARRRRRKEEMNIKGYVVAKAQGVIKGAKKNDWKREALLDLSG